MVSSFKKVKIKLKVLTNIDMLLMMEKCIGGEKCHAICWYLKSNNKHERDYDKSKES